MLLSPGGASLQVSDDSALGRIKHATALLVAAHTFIEHNRHAAAMELVRQANQMLIQLESEDHARNG